MIRRTDEARLRVRQGERLDPSKRTGCFPLFMVVATGVTSMRDAEIFRRTVRRNGFLDRTAVFDEDVALQELVERLFAEMLAAGPPPPPGPPRDDLLALLAKAAGPAQEGESAPGASATAADSCAMLDPREGVEIGGASVHAGALMRQSAQRSHGWWWPQ